MASFTPLIAEHTFNVLINPCKVVSIDPKVFAAELFYNINQPTKTGAYYEFEQSPACGYPQTVTILDLPAFVTHNDASSEFTILKSSDGSLVGEYTVTIRSEVQVPDDYTKSTFTPVTGEFQFVIKVKSCIVTSYAV